MRKTSILLLNVRPDVAAEEVGKPTSDREVANLDHTGLPPLVALHEVALHRHQRKVHVIHDANGLRTLKHPRGKIEVAARV